jgi:hypothetical protein
MTKPWIWLIVAAVLLAIGTTLHTIATTSGTVSFTSTPGPPEQAVLDAMRSFHFDIMGSSRMCGTFIAVTSFPSLSYFAGPGVMSALIALCLTLARSSRDSYEPVAAVPHASMG